MATPSLASNLPEHIFERRNCFRKDEKQTFCSKAVLWILVDRDSLRKTGTQFELGSGHMWPHVRRPLKTHSGEKSNRHTRWNKRWTIWKWTLVTIENNHLWWLGAVSVHQEWAGRSIFHFPPLFTFQGPPPHLSSLQYIFFNPSPLLNLGLPEKKTGTQF